MAQKSNEEREMHQSIEMGEANSALIRRLQPWCSHLNVKLVSSGLLAQMSGLPIGRMSIECPHAKKGISAMDLRRVAAYFVNENCRNCPHHEELNADNAGREILREAENVNVERSKTAESNSSPAKLRLLGLVSGDLTQALLTAPTTEQSILELVALLDDDIRCQEAAQSLEQAANIAPDFFSPLACEVIAENLPELRIGAKCAKILRTLGNKRGELPKVSIEAALKCVYLQFCHDETLALLGDYFATGGELPRVPDIARIIGHQGYGGDNFISVSSPHYPGLEYALQEIGKRDLQRLGDAFVRKLENPDKIVRVGAAITLQNILKLLPDLGPLLVNDLIASLDLDDDRYGRHSADMEAVRALGIIFMFDPTGTQQKLNAAFLHADEEVKELIFRIYRGIADAASTSRFAKSTSLEAVACLPKVLDVLIPAIMDPNKPLEVRKSAASTIERIASSHPALVSQRTDALFGALAMVSYEEAEFRAKNPGGDPLLPALPRSETQAYGLICKEIIDALKELSEFAATSVHTTLVGMLSPLGSKELYHVLLKTRLVSLLSSISHDHTVGPAIVPELFRALMDMESVSVRLTALEAIEEVLRWQPELIPDNMREVIILYLTDMYVAIHKGAARAARYLKPMSKDEAQKIASLILRQFMHYSGENGDPSHCKVLCSTMIRICTGHPDLFLKYAGLMLLEQIHSQDDFDAEDALDG